jgi:hypothetical protein
MPSIEPIVIVLLLWLSANLGLPLVSEVPRVVRVPAPKIAAIHVGRSGGTNLPDVVGAYDTRTGTIYLRHDWTSHSAVDVSVLVHELVHHVQHRAGFRYECPQAREKLAFEAQARWLALVGENLQSAFGLDPLTLKLRTQCGPP